MSSVNIKHRLKRIYKPFRPIYTRMIRWYGKRNKKWLISRVYEKQLGRKIDWNNPQDLNEKINWLKLHADPYEWAYLADKYRVREYVISRGLEDILVPLYGHWNSAQEVIDDWNKLPDEFVLKCNNGNGKILLIKSSEGGKAAVDLEKLRTVMEGWIQSEYSGISGTEPHYSLINNCIIAEKLLHDKGENQLSGSIIDYKFWCFNGKPYGCFVCTNRNIVSKEKDSYFFDLDWNPHPEVLTKKLRDAEIEKPEKWDKMIEIASKLSSGHPQVRVDLYYSSGKIYFGEMTMTAKGGFMTIYTENALLEMGRQIRLDLSMQGNIFDK